MPLTPTEWSKPQLCTSWLKRNTVFHPDLIRQVGSAKTGDCKQAIWFPKKTLLQIPLILSTAILIEMGMERAQHISGSRSKYRNCIFVLVMCLVFSQPQQFFMFIKNRCSFDLDFFLYLPEPGSCRSEHTVTMTEGKYDPGSKYFQIIPWNIQHQYWF